MTTTQYTLSKDGLKVFAYNVDANGNPLGMATVYTKASLTAKIASLTTQDTSVQAQVTDLTTNALSLFA